VRQVATSYSRTAQIGRNTTQVTVVHTNCNTSTTWKIVRWHQGPSRKGTESNYRSQSPLEVTSFCFLHFPRNLIFLTHCVEGVAPPVMFREEDYIDDLTEIVRQWKAEQEETNCLCYTLFRNVASTRGNQTRYRIAEVEDRWWRVLNDAQMFKGRFGINFKVFMIEQLWYNAFFTIMIDRRQWDNFCYVKSSTHLGNFRLEGDGGIVHLFVTQVQILVGSTELSIVKRVYSSPSWMMCGHWKCIHLIYE
jgi:hypothetical protein